MRTALLFLLAGFLSAAQARTEGPISYPGLSYPTSCLAWPVFYDMPSGPTVTRTTTLAVVDRATGQAQGFEPVTFTFWRVPCNAGRSALLMRITRAGGNLNRVLQWPTLYGLTARQGTTSGLVRLSQHPNSPEAVLPPGALIPVALTVTVENFYHYEGINGGAVLPGAPGDSGPYFDFNQALEITIPDPSALVSAPPLVVSIPAYDPALYPAASLPLFITGHNAGSYFDPAHPGEGMFVGVTTDQVGDFMLLKRSITVAWFTYGRDGRPFWLYGNLQFTPGIREATVPLTYAANGGFAGAATGTRSPWGTLVVSFPDCGTMRFSYSANANLPDPVPTGSGQRSWARLTAENGLDCL